MIVNPAQQFAGLLVSSGLLPAERELPHKADDLTRVVLQHQVVKI